MMNEDPHPSLAVEVVNQPVPMPRMIAIIIMWIMRAQM